LIIFKNFEDGTKQKSPQIKDLQAFFSFNNAFGGP
jgi:hypothetical protein